MPNDPRGSWSDFVRSWELFRHGTATKVTTRRSVAGVAHDRAKRLTAKQALKYPPVRFDGTQAREIARGFQDAAKEAGYAILACAILPDHTHLVVGRHPRDDKRMMAHLKSKATMRLSDAGLHPFAPFSRGSYTPSPWAAKGWCVFVDTLPWVHAAIRYVEANPEKEGLPRQRWKFVVPYNG